MVPVAVMSPRDVYRAATGDVAVGMDVTLRSVDDHGVAVEREIAVHQNRGVDGRNGRGVEICETRQDAATVTVVPRGPVAVARRIILAFMSTAGSPFSPIALSWVPTVVCRASQAAPYNSGSSSSRSWKLYE